MVGGHAVPVLCPAPGGHEPMAGGRQGPCAALRSSLISLRHRRTESTHRCLLGTVQRQRSTPPPLHQPLSSKASLYREGLSVALA